MFGDRLICFAQPLQRSNLCASHRQRRWLTYLSQNYVPEGYSVVTPSLTVSDADKAIAFYREVFGATVLPNSPSRLQGRGLLLRDRDRRFEGDDHR